jgi:hypothetical protein
MADGRRGGSGDGSLVAIGDGRSGEAVLATAARRVAPPSPLEYLALSASLSAVSFRSLSITIPCSFSTFCACNFSGRVACGLPSMLATYAQYEQSPKIPKLLVTVTARSFTTALKFC